MNSSPPCYWASTIRSSRSRTCSAPSSLVAFGTRCSVPSAARRATWLPKEPKPVSHAHRPQKAPEHPPCMTRRSRTEWSSIACIESVFPTRPVHFLSLSFYSEHVFRIVGSKTPPSHDHKALTSFIAVLKKPRRINKR